MGLINVFATQQFLQFSMAVMSFVIGLIACNELKIAQIAFYGSSRTLMSKNVNNDVSKDSPFPNILLMNLVCNVDGRHTCIWWSVKGTDDN